jgi:2-amino-4-hydroxy-6-hydroxymethyldihydropteridine diphosphokinase
VALGANLGDAQATLRQALQRLSSWTHTSILATSSFYKTAPLQASGPDFINAAVLVHTQLSPLALLHALQAMELAFGRERPYRNAPRTLDLDLIVYGDVQMDTPELVLPHPRYRERAFVLHPMAEIVPEWVNPAWLAAVADQPIVRL